MLLRSGSAVAALREGTGPDHDVVDSAFGGFDLADRASYATFLTAHAKALPAVEAILAATPGLPTFRPRTPLLAADLASLGEPMPPPLPLTLPDGEAAAWGALYVIEGSRLGGTLLSRSVANSWPSAYLGAKHLPGEWRALLTAIDAAATDDAWIAEAITGAKAIFDLYRRAV